MIENIVGNLASNVIWIVFGAVFTAAIYLSTLLPKYRTLTRFFGVSSSCPRLRVYFSRLNIPRGGSVDAQGVARNYSGAAIPEYEFAVVETLLRPFLALAPRRVPRSILKKMESWGLFKRPEIVFGASPLRDQDIEFVNLILIGSQGYNVVTEYYLTRGNPYLTLDLSPSNPAVVIRRGRNTGERIPPKNDVAVYDIAILVKIRDAEHDTTVFIGAGMGVNGTRGAIEYLMNRWEELHKTYGDQEFGLCLRFPPVTEDPQGFRKPVVLRRLPY
jgi:hypothetical protein